MARRGAEALTALSRAVAVLEEVSRHRKAPSFSTLQRQLGLPKSSLHRTLAALLDERLLEFKPEQNGYQLGLRLAGLSLKAVHGLQIRDAVRPEIEELSRITQENVLVAQRDDTKLVYVDRIQSQQTLQMVSQLGNQAPLHCTGLGKTLLAFEDAENIEAIIPRLVLERFTENTICSVEALRSELMRIKTVGYATDLCEHQPEIHCIAAPIYQLNSKAFAAVSISTPVFRVSQTKLLSWKDALLDCAERISRKLGGSTGSAVR